jgi:hypothetical protein
MGKSPLLSKVPVPDTNYRVNYALEDEPIPNAGLTKGAFSVQTKQKPPGKNRTACKDYVGLCDVLKSKAPSFGLYVSYRRDRL